MRCGSRNRLDCLSAIQGESTNCSIVGIGDDDGDDGGGGDDGDGDNADDNYDGDEDEDEGEDGGDNYDEDDGGGDNDDDGGGDDDDDYSDVITIVMRLLTSSFHLHSRSTNNVSLSPLQRQGTLARTCSALHLS